MCCRESKGDKGVHTAAFLLRDAATALERTVTLLSTTGVEIRK